MNATQTQKTEMLGRGVRFKTACTCGDDGVEAGRQAVQMGWYRLAATLVRGMTVLDVGCGIGDGMVALACHAASVAGIDLDDRLRRPDIDIQVKNITDIPDESVDAVVCIDVIEHVEHDSAFVAQLVRVARKLVFISTPNYAVSLNEWPYHFREYTPRQLGSLLEPHGTLRVFGGIPSGDEMLEIRNRALYYLLCDLYCYHGTDWIAKLLKRLSFTRVWQHQAIALQLPSRATRP
jgi:SAM-dependent methyltransferase